jgi:hypothetical protein
MTEVLSGAVQRAMLEKAHRRAVADVMQSDLGDVQRVAAVLALEAEFLGHMERLRVEPENGPVLEQEGIIDRDE